MNLLKKIEEPSLQIIGYVVLAFLFMYILTPLSWLFLTAFSERGSPYLEIPERITLDNFIAIFLGKRVGHGISVAHPSSLYRWVINSLILASTTMILVVLLAAPASYALSRLRFRGKSVLMTALLLMGFMPMTAKMLPLFKLCKEIGFINNLIGTAVVIASGTTPMQVWILKGFFDHIPRDLEEQAWICGCSRLETLLRVILPSVGPGLMVTAFMSFLSGWGSFTVPLILIRSEDVYPISVGLASIFTHVTGMEKTVAVEFELVCALSVIYVIPAIIVYYIFRKHLMEIKLGRMEVR